MNQSQKFESLLQSTQRPLIFLPKNAAEDEIASAIVLCEFFKTQKKSAKIIADLCPKTLLSKKQKMMPFTAKNEFPEILPGIGTDKILKISVPIEETQIKTLSHSFSRGNLEILLETNDLCLTPNMLDLQNGVASDSDTVFVLGAESLEDLGQNFEKSPELFQEKLVVNISFFPSEFGVQNFVFPNSSGVSEILTMLFSEETLQTIPQAKNILLAGVLSQSESFLGTKNRANTFFAASKLQALGADHSIVVENLYKKVKFDSLKAFSQMIQSLSIDPQFKTAWSMIPEENFENLSSEEILLWGKRVFQYIIGIDNFILFTPSHEISRGYVFSPHKALLSEVFAIDSADSPIKIKNYRGFSVLESKTMSAFEFKNFILKKLEVFLIKDFGLPETEKLSSRSLEYFVSEKKNKPASVTPIVSDIQKSLEKTIPFELAP